MAKKVGVDLGGTHIRAGIVENGKVANYIKIKTPKTKEKLLKKLCEVISLSLEKGGKEIHEIGIASPGPLKNGVIENTPNIPLQNFNLKKFLEKKFRKKIIVQNDVKCIALSELNYGIKKKNFIVIALGTGVGGGIIIGKSLYTGKGNAGEVGHMIIEGKKDLEYFWKRSLKKMKKDYGKEFFIKNIMKSKDKNGKLILNEIYTFLGIGIGSLVNIFDPEEIVLMGGGREAGNKFTKELAKEAKKYTILKRFPKISWSKIKHPGVLGAGLLFE